MFFVSRGDDMTKRIDLLIEGAKRSGLTMDYLEALTAGLSKKALRKVIGNASAIPSYMKSRESPYLFRRASAASSEMRAVPASQLDN